jgi:hypothetical protein
MIRRLELDALRSDLAAVERMVASAKDQGDRIGEMQFLDRRSELLGLIADREAQADKTGKVALIFGGRPVIGSYGAEADFFGVAVARFQGVVDRFFSANEVGRLGSRGPTAKTVESQMLVTGLARGSFGVVLEEAALTDALTDTALKVVITEVVSSLTGAADPDEDVFSDAVTRLDPRVLSSLKSFLDVLDDSEATLKLVEQENAPEFDRASVARARRRIAETSIQEVDGVQVVGTLLGLLPEHRKFEMRRLDDGTTIYGQISTDVARHFFESIQSGFDNPIGRTWRAIFRVRRVQTFGRPERHAYILQRLVEPVGES